MRRHDLLIALKADLRELLYIIDGDKYPVEESQLAYAYDALETLLELENNGTYITKKNAL